MDCYAWFFLVVAALYSSVLHAVNLSGEWRGTFKCPEDKGVHSLNFKLIQKGNNLSGDMRIKSNTGQYTQKLEGYVDDDLVFSLWGTETSRNYSADAFNGSVSKNEKRVAGVASCTNNDGIFTFFKSKTLTQLVEDERKAADRKAQLEKRRAMEEYQQQMDEKKRALSAEEERNRELRERTVRLEKLYRILQGNWKYTDTATYQLADFWGCNRKTVIVNQNMSFTKLDKVNMVIIGSGQFTKTDNEFQVGGSDKQNKTCEKKNKRSRDSQISYTVVYKIYDYDENSGEAVIESSLLNCEQSYLNIGTFSNKVHQFQCSNVVVENQQKNLRGSRIHIADDGALTYFSRLYYPFAGSNASHDRGFVLNR